MSGKIQIVVVTIALALGGSGAQWVARDIASQPGVLYLAGQYKLMRGDTQSALHLFRKAAATPHSARAGEQTTLPCWFQFPGTGEVSRRTTTIGIFDEPTLNR